jgi:hypothetical protein
MTLTPDKARQVLELELPFQSDFGKVTIRQALIRLLSMMWDDPEGFTGYRPLGNSDWPDQIMASVIEAGLAVNEEEADSVIRCSISYLSAKSKYSTK